MLVVVAAIAAFFADRALQLALYIQGNAHGLKLMTAVRIATVASLPLLVSSPLLLRWLRPGNSSPVPPPRESLVVVGALAAIVGFVVPMLLVALLVSLKLTDVDRP
ncbi:MAG TPA: hypothetical protein VFI31_05140 [Pirellulales bacterium]|nr:hypothetical protein [Pirellulales bacterium]